jgi:DNA-binding HxlR family transcriptional regulator
MERDALVSRTVYPTVPAKVEYALTETGESLFAILGGLTTWAGDHRETIMSSRARWDADLASLKHSL